MAFIFFQTHSGRIKPAGCKDRWKGPVLGLVAVGMETKGSIWARSLELNLETNWMLEYRAKEGKVSGLND